VADPANEKTRGLWEHVEHLIGKDILKPHGVYWPTMLKAAGLPLYRRLDVTGYWLVGGGKMSKSVGNVVEAFALAGKYGKGAFWYFLMREMPFGLDASFTEEAFVGRLNADLANDLGNLASRATTMIVNFGGGTLPAAAPGASALGAELDRTRDEVAAAMEHFAFHRALTTIWAFIAQVTRLVDATQAWAVAQDSAHGERLDAVVSERGEPLRCRGILLEPFVPDAAAKIRAAVSAPAPRLPDARFGLGAPGARVQRLAAL